MSHEFLWYLNLLESYWKSNVSLLLLRELRHACQSKDQKFPRSNKFAKTYNAVSGCSAARAPVCGRARDPGQWKSALLARAASRHVWFQSGPLTLARCVRNLNGTLDAQIHTHRPPPQSPVLKRQLWDPAFFRRRCQMILPRIWRLKARVREWVYRFPLLTWGIRGKLTEDSRSCCYVDAHERVTAANKHTGGFSRDEMFSLSGFSGPAAPDVRGDEPLYKAELRLPELLAVGRAGASGIDEASWTRDPFNTSERLCSARGPRWPPGNPRELARAAFWRI